MVQKDFGHAAARQARLRRAAATFAAAAALLFVQQFLSVHEAQHVGDSHAGHCPFAPLASTIGGAGLQAVPALAPPLSTPANHLEPAERGHWAPSVDPQARGPPRA
jgi:hypothetical protein